MPAEVISIEAFKPHSGARQRADTIPVDVFLNRVSKSSARGFRIQLETISRFLSGDRVSFREFDWGFPHLCRYSCVRQMLVERVRPRAGPTVATCALGKEFSENVSRREPTRQNSKR